MTSRRGSQAAVAPAPSTLRRESNISDREKIVQLLIDGVLLVKPIAPNICEGTMVSRLEDTGKIPRKILNSFVGRSLAVMSGVKGYFERNGLVVDKEVRDAFVANIPKAVVTSQVSAIVEELKSVNFVDEMWKPLTKDILLYVSQNNLARRCRTPF